MKWCTLTNITIRTGDRTYIATTIRSESVLIVILVNVYHLILNIFKKIKFQSNMYKMGAKTQLIKKIRGYKCPCANYLTPLTSLSKIEAG